MEDISRVAQALGGTLVKLADNYGVSWALTHPERGNTVQKWVELFARKQESHQYPTFSMPLSKVMNALHLESHTAIPALLVVRFADGIVTTYFNSFLDSPRIIRAQPKDKESIGIDPMWHIPVERMRRILDIEPPSAPAGGGTGTERTERTEGTEGGNNEENGML